MKIGIDFPSKTTVKYIQHAGRAKSNVSNNFPLNLLVHISLFGFLLPSSCMHNELNHVSGLLFKRCCSSKMGFFAHRIILTMFANKTCCCLLLIAYS